ncbi:hypothetical protein SDC9_105162 [bioreactor metagenome]|uniref:Uncharacterized protein n=1 Tax=bioreactor metagenome TaxID=1076179 RepID=A0A645B195_9ZZZZ
MSGESIHPDAVQIVDGRSQPDRLSDRRCAGLEAMRRRRIGRALHPDDLDHLAAAEEGRQLLEQVVVTPQHTDAGGTAEFVTGEGQQIHPESRHVGGPLRNALRTVRHHDRADRVGPVGDLADRVDSAQYVADPGDRDDFRPFVDQPVALCRFQIEPAVVGDVEPAQGRPACLASQLPGHQIRMVLHHRDDDLIAGLQPAAEGIGGQVERLGGVLGKDDLIGRASVDELRHLHPGTFECCRGLGPQRVHGAGDVGVVAQVVRLHSLDDLAGFLRGVRRVEIDQRVPVDFPVENREISTDSGGVPHQA